MKINIKNLYEIELKHVFRSLCLGVTNNSQIYQIVQFLVYSWALVEFC